MMSKMIMNMMMMNKMIMSKDAQLIQTLEEVEKQVIEKEIRMDLLQSRHSTVTRVSLPDVATIILDHSVLRRRHIADESLSEGDRLH